MAMSREGATKQKESRAWEAEAGVALEQEFRGKRHGGSELGGDEVSEQLTRVFGVTERLLAFSIRELGA